MLIFNSVIIFYCTIFNKDIVMAIGNIIFILKGLNKYSNIYEQLNNTILMMIIIHTVIIKIIIYVIYNNI